MNETVKNDETSNLISLASSVITSNKIINKKKTRSFVTSTRNVISLKSRCFRDISLFNWNDWCNNADVTLSLTQLFDMTSKIKMNMINVMKINNFKKKQIQFATNIEFEWKINNVFTENDFILFDSSSSMKSKLLFSENIIYKITKVMIETSDFN